MFNVNGCEMQLCHLEGGADCHDDKNFKGLFFSDYFFCCKGTAFP